MSPLSVSPYAQMLGNLEARVAMKMQHCMSNSTIFFVIKEEAQKGGKRPTSRSKR